MQTSGEGISKFSHYGGGKKWKDMSETIVCMWTIHSLAKQVHIKNLHSEILQIKCNCVIS